MLRCHNRQVSRRQHLILVTSSRWVQSLYSVHYLLLFLSIKWLALTCMWRESFWVHCSQKLQSHWLVHYESETFRQCSIVQIYSLLGVGKIGKIIWANMWIYLMMETKIQTNIQIRRKQWLFQKKIIFTENLIPV